MRLPAPVCLIVTSAIVLSLYQSEGRAQSNAAGSESALSAAVRLEQQGRERAAITSYSKYLLTQPTSEVGWIGVARCYMKLKEFGMVEKTLDDSVTKVKSTDAQKAIVQELISKYASTGDLAGLQRARRRYVAMFPNAPDVKKMTDIIAYFDKDFANIKRVETQRADFKLEGYYPWLRFRQLPDMPIRVCVAPDKYIKPGSPFFKKQAHFSMLYKRALTAWSQAADDKLEFVFVDNPANAQLHCEWTTDTAKRTHSFADGETHYDRTPLQGPLRSVALVYLNKTKSDVSDAEFYETALHEIGHAVGLSHSSKPADIMYGGASGIRRGWPVLSQSDRTRVRHIYCDPFGGKLIAEEFVKAAYIDRDYERAYQMLSGEQRAKTSLDAFSNKMQSDAASVAPASATATGSATGSASASATAFTTGSNSASATASDSASVSAPVVLRICSFDRTPKANLFNYGLQTTCGSEKLYFHVAVVSDATGRCAVHSSNRVAAQSR